MSIQKRIILLLLPAFFSFGLEKVWDYQSEELPINNGRILIRVAEGVKTPDGETPLEVIQNVPQEDLLYSSHIQFPAQTEGIKNGDSVQISFWIKGATGTSISIRVTEVLPYSGHFSDTVSIDMDGNWQKINHEFIIRNMTGEAYAAMPRLLLIRHFPETPFFIGPITIKTAPPVQTENSQPANVNNDTEFRPMTERNLYVEPGSALDLSSLTEHIPAGALGRIIVNENGALAFEKRPEQPVRFFCCSFAHHEESAFLCYTHEELEKFADAIVRQGYNMIRFHYLDDMLSGTKREAYLKDWENMTITEYPQTAEEISFDPRYTDRFLYFINECGKRGIYVNLDLMSSFRGYVNGQLPLLKENAQYTTKMQLFVDETRRKNWKAGVQRLMNLENPYNGYRLKEDPVVAFSCALNEQDIQIPSRNYGEVFHPRWIQYLRNKYSTLEALRESWGTSDITSFEDVPKIGGELEKNSPMGRDMARFCVDLEVEISKFYIEAMNEIANGLLVSNWNMSTRFFDTPARAEMPFIMLNRYHSHPLWKANVTVTHDSAIKMGGNVVRNFATMRFLDRPFVATEYNFVFWNKLRHEQGLMMGGAAALQDWSGLTVFTCPVVHGTRRMECFSTGVDPVMRASQILEFFAFMRRDVSPSKNTIEIPVDDAYLFSKNPMRGLNNSVSKLWSVCKIGLTYGPAFAPIEPLLKVRLESDADNSTFQVNDDSIIADSIEPIIDALRRKGGFPQSNITDVKADVFQSDTGEIIVDYLNAEMAIQTPRFEGAILKTSKAKNLNDVSIHHCNVPATLAAISLENDKTLSESPRILIVFATDAQNSNMIFADEKQEQMKDYGNLPILLKTGEFSMEIRRDKVGKPMHLYALDLTGKRIAELPFDQTENSIVFSVNTAIIPETPSLFFEFAEMP